MESSAELSIGGRVATPKDPDWDEARSAWNLVAEQRPEAVALVESADDVAKTIAFASEHDLKVAAQGTGHGAAPLGPLDDTILIKTGRMRAVEVDGKQAKVEAGVLSEELGAAAHADGCCFLPGSSPNVGVIGYTLTFDQIATPALSRIAMDPEPPVPALGDHAPLSDLPDEAVDTFIGMAGPQSGSPLLLAQLSHVGGALSRPAENAGALDKLDCDWLMFGVGMPMSPEVGEAIDGHLDKLADSMRPWTAAGGFFNFAERPGDIDAILPDATCERLLDVKREWDPDGRIVANHALSLSAA